MPGDHSELEPPLPIPNRSVKRLRADDSADYPCESRSSPGSYNAKPLDSMCCEGFLLCALRSRQSDSKIRNGPTEYLVVFSPPTLKTPLEELAPQFERSSAPPAIRSRSGSTA